MSLTCPHTASHSGDLFILGRKQLKHLKSPCNTQLGLMTKHEFLWVILETTVPLRLTYLFSWCFCACVCRNEVGWAAVSSDGGHRRFIPGPADPWHKAGGPVQCRYQHLGSGPKPQCQHGRWEQKPWASTTDPCAGPGRVSGLLWCGCKCLKVLHSLIVFPPQILFDLHCW